MTKDIRGYCKVCSNRTRHKIKDDTFLCVFCEKNMALEDKIDPIDEKILKTVKKANLSPRELQILLAQPQQVKVNKKLYDHSNLTHGKFGVISDTHIGVQQFDEAFFAFAAKTFKKEGIDTVYHVGDILEGMSGRPGHIYELSQIGFSQQINYAEKLFKKYYKDFDIFGITGNHDQWYKKKNNGGVDVGEEMQARVPNFTYLGENEADVQLGKGVTMKLFHANDGSAYATSYKMQKLIESLESGKKPNIIIEGHYHKALYMFNRNVHAIEAGTFCGQTEFMRGKKLPAHKGFWTVDYEIGKRNGRNSLVSFTPKFYAAYD